MRAPSRSSDVAARPGSLFAVCCSAGGGPGALSRDGRRTDSCSREGQSRGLRMDSTVVRIVCRAVKHFLAGDHAGCQLPHFQQVGLGLGVKF